MKKVLMKWMALLDIAHWHITFVPIDRDQVDYPDDIEDNEKYFIGVMTDRENNRAWIFHDRPVTEEDVLHELLHVMLPDATEKQISILTLLLLL